MGRRGVNFSFKLFLPVFATRSGGGEGIRGLWFHHKKNGLEPNPSEQNRIYSCTIIEDESPPDKNAVFPRLNVLNKSLRVHAYCCIDCCSLKNLVAVYCIRRYLKVRGFRVHIFSFIFNTRKRGRGHKRGVNT